MNARHRLDFETSLSRRFAETRIKGALQNRAARGMELLDTFHGGELVGVVAATGRHVGQLALEFLATDIGLITNYDSAVPILGPSSKIARAKTAASSGVGEGKTLDKKNDDIIHH